MGLFKNRKRKTVEVEVQGENFILTEPSALAMCEYYDIMEREHGLVKDGSSIYFKSGINTKVGFRLVAACLVDHFIVDGQPTQTPNNIYRMLCDEVTNMNDVNKLIHSAEDAAGLKFEEKELQDESLETD